MFLCTLEFFCIQTYNFDSDLTVVWLGIYWCCIFLIGRFVQSDWPLGLVTVVTWHYSSQTPTRVYGYSVILVMCNNNNLVALRCDSVTAWFYEFIVVCFWAQFCITAMLCCCMRFIRCTYFLLCHTLRYVHVFWSNYCCWFLGTTLQHWLLHIYEFYLLNILEQHHIFFC